MPRNHYEYPYKNDKGELLCLLCQGYFKHLGSHIFHKHGYLAREYKSEYELPCNMPLTTSEIRQKQCDKCTTWKQNFKDSAKYAFKAGVSKMPKISRHQKKMQIEQINKVNTDRVPELCPVCKMVFDNLTSHLFNAHGMLKVAPGQSKS